MEQAKFSKDQINALFKSHNELNAEIKNIENVIDEENSISRSLLEKKNSLVQSYEIELELQLFPANAYGSVQYYNELNEKFDFFNMDQFNKIIRFISHVEETEKQYRNQYLHLCENYFNNPDICNIDNLKEIFSALNSYYAILALFTEECNKDRVLFNITYNKLEDKGFFMTLPEMNMLNTTSQISESLKGVVEELKYMSNSISINNKWLNKISKGIDELIDSNYGIEFGLDDLSWEVSYLSSQIK